VLVQRTKCVLSRRSSFHSRSWQHSLKSCRNLTSGLGPPPAASPLLPHFSFRHRRESHGGNSLISAIDTALRANEIYAERYDPALGRPPAPTLAVVTCIDPRLTEVHEALGLKPGDADVIRNAGTTVTGDVIRSLLVSTRVLGAGEILIINHTGCGMMTFKDDDLQAAGLVRDCGD
jgi:hypothetical protein